MKYKLFIFDLDGTVLDTLDDLADSTNYALSAFGMPCRSRDQVRCFVGNGIGRLIRRAVPDDTPDDVAADVRSLFNAYYKEHCRDKTRPYDGIIDLLEDIRKAGGKTAVVSNKADYAVQLLCGEYFNGLLDIAAGEREGIRRKPSPDSVNAVLAQLGIERGEAVYIGDSDVDVLTAKNAGLDMIGVDWGFRSRDFLEKEGAVVIVSSPMEILSVCK